MLLYPCKGIAYCIRNALPDALNDVATALFYFAGEVIDCDAYTGGFNLQIAFSTGKLAGLSVSEKYDYL